MEENYSYSQRDYKNFGLDCLDAKGDLTKSSSGWEGQSDRGFLRVYQKTEDWIVQSQCIFIQFRNAQSEEWGSEKRCIRLAEHVVKAYEGNWRTYDRIYKKLLLKSPQAAFFKRVPQDWTPATMQMTTIHRGTEYRFRLPDDCRAGLLLELRLEKNKIIPKIADGAMQAFKDQREPIFSKIQAYIIRNNEAAFNIRIEHMSRMQKLVAEWYFMEENQVKRQFELFNDHGNFFFKIDGSKGRLGVCHEWWQADVDLDNKKTFLLKPHEKTIDVMDVMIVDTPSIKTFQRAQAAGTVSTRANDDWMDAHRLKSCIGKWEFQAETIDIEKPGHFICRFREFEGVLIADPESEWNLVELNGGKTIIRLKPNGTSLLVKMMTYSSKPLTAERQKERVPLYKQKRCWVASAIMAIIVIIAIVIAATKKIKIVPPSFPSTPSGACIAMQIHTGCAPNFCWPSGECRCEPNLIQGGPKACLKSMARHDMTFHMYALRGDEVQNPTYPVDALSPHGDAEVGNLTYSLQGVLWYLHEKVITSSCPRKQHITRIVRFKATVHNPNHPGFQGQFGPFADYSDGICKGAEGQIDHCGELYKKYGHGVGCLDWQPYMGGIPYGNLTHVYSLPGKEGANGTKSGWCASPNGGSTCTWHLEEAGEVTLNELAHIRNYGEFCARGGVEYNSRTDRGTGCSFWDDKKNSVANEARLTKLQNLFLKKFPDTKYAYGRPEPNCDARNAQCKYNKYCKSQGLIGQCCPAATGRMLGCCSGPTGAEHGFMM